MSLKIKGLTAQVVETEQKVLRGVNLEIMPGEVHVLMGPNGSGKSSLGKVLLAHPEYEQTKGKIFLTDKEITTLDTTARAQLGIFLASQYPTEVPGVNLTNFLRLAYNSQRPESERISLFKFRKLLKSKMEEVGLPQDFMGRNLNEGFSGGEKKKCELLQMLLFEPKYAILDETDSGLDVDAIRTVFSNLAKMIEDRKELGLLIITHYHRLFDYITPDYVHRFENGKIVETSGIELAERIDSEGYKVS